MSATGYIQVQAFASNAKIPLPNVSVAITDQSGSAIALRLTNRSGMLDKPIQVEVPDLSASQTPNTGIIPFSTVNLYARLNGYEEIEIENLQIFANTMSVQNLEMIPLSEFPESWNQAELFRIPSQNL